MLQHTLGDLQDAIRELGFALKLANVSDEVCILLSSDDLRKIEGIFPVRGMPYIEGIKFVARKPEPQYWPVLA